MRNFRLNVIINLWISTLICWNIEAIIKHWFNILKRSWQAFWSKFYVAARRWYCVFDYEEYRIGDRNDDILDISILNPENEQKSYILYYSNDIFREKAEDLIAYLSEYDERRYLHFRTMRMDGKNFKLDD